MLLEHGGVHLVEAGSGPPVLLLHQTPRSWDEYRDVLPLLAAAGYRAIALDTPGFGDSTALQIQDSIETWASAAAEVLRALDAAPAAVVGHHTGAMIAVELAATHPAMVTHLVLSSGAYTDSEFRAKAAQSRVEVDSAEVAADGSHLQALWASRASFYPPGRHDLLDRYIIDALRAGERRESGHAAVVAYEMDDKPPKVTVPVLLIGAPADPFAYPEQARLAAQFPGAQVVDLEGGMVPLPDQLPNEFAATLVEFLRDDSG